MRPMSWSMALAVVSGPTGRSSPVKRRAAPARSTYSGLALAVPRVGLEAELVEERDQGVLVGRDPLAADLEQGAVVLLAAQPAADAVAGLEDDDVLAGLGQPPGGDQAGDAPADDDGVDGCVMAGHQMLSFSTRDP